MASQLSSIAYTGYSGASLGTLTYTYALDGTVNSRSGTLFTSVLPAAVTSSAYNAANQLTSRVTASGTQTPTWDANGSMTSDGLNAYTWDPRNRMKSIGSQASFVYDAFGRRTSVTKNGLAPIAYLYSGNDVIQEQQSGSVLAQMITGLGVDERYVRAGELVLTDLLGSTVALSNGSTIQTNYAYDPYGVTTAAGAATANTYQFTGRENDGTTAGLMFYRARYYNPAWGKFVSEDPIGVKGGVNLYAYVRSHPTISTDPLGTQEFFLSEPPEGWLPWAELPWGSQDGPGAGKLFPRNMGPCEGEMPDRTYCGKPTLKEPKYSPRQLNRDHIIPRSRGGNNSPENYTPACRECNMSKGAKTPQQWYQDNGWGPPAETI